MSTRTSEQISHNMKQNKNKNSKIKLLLRKELWKRSLRYRKNPTNIISRPDIVYISKKVAIFCDSEFWHGYDWEQRKHDIKSNGEFWIKKIEGNIDRDKKVNELLKNQRWTVLRFWGKKIQKETTLCADIIERTIKNI